MNRIANLIAAVLILASLCTAQTAVEQLRHALNLYHAERYTEAETAVKSLILSHGGEQLDDAMYLLIRIHLARGEGSEAVEAADRLLNRFPQSDFVPFAHFSRAEGYYLQERWHACSDELNWVIQYSGDSRLIERAREVLPDVEAQVSGPVDFTEPDDRSEAGYHGTELVEGRVVFVLAFPDLRDPAVADLRRSIRFAADYGDFPYPATIVTATSAFETEYKVQHLMEDDDLLLLVFAGEEGAATVTALLSASHEVPVLKLTSYPRPFTSISPYLWEFLPSQVTCARAFGRFAINDLDHPSAMILAAADEKGRALAEGFTQGVTEVRGAIDALEYYDPYQTAIHNELADVFANEARIARGERPLRVALTEEEREEMFGDTEVGEVLLGDLLPDPLADDTSAATEAFFFTLSADKIDIYSTQLRALPPRTTLLGNSSWIDPDALMRQREITESMYVVAPLLPEVPDTNALVRRYSAVEESNVSPWELLGLDAGEYVGRIMALNPRTRDDVERSFRRNKLFKGRAVDLDFGTGHENRAARILWYKEGELRVVR